MRRRNVKVNNVGGASCLLLAILTVMAVCPVAGSSSAYAEEGVDDTDADDGASTLAVTNSTVTIGFTPESANASVTPVDSTGAKAKIDVRAMVRVQNSGGYSVYVGSSSSDLQNGVNTIPSVTSATTYANMPVNRWGYSFAKGTTVSDSYVAMPATLRGTSLDSNTSTSIRDETQTYMLSFAANIGADKPTGTYSNQVTMSVVSSPLEVTNDFGITTMQQMTSTVCANATDLDGDGEISAQLEDMRDGKYYWVSKLKDNKCWMTQNLDLDLSTSKTLTPNDSDVAGDWAPEYTTATQVTSSTILADNTGQRSWSLGNYRITNPTASSDCGYPKSSVSQCSGQFTNYTTPTNANGDTNAHYIIGNHYQWNAATAGTGGKITSGQAAGSICSKGWKLPESNETAAGSFGGLVNAYSVGSDVSKLVASPLYFVRGGIVYQSAATLLNYAGNRGYYWSSTPRSSDRAFHLRFYGATTVDPSYYDSGSRQLGYSVRCIAR